MSGTKTRTRTPAVEAANGGAACQDMSQTIACNTHFCPIDCVMADWSDWTTCSKTCGGGQQSRSRSRSVHPAHGGASCGYGLYDSDSPEVQQQECGTTCCVVNCEWAPWREWEECSQECTPCTPNAPGTACTAGAVGTQSRVRFKSAERTTDSACEGAECAGDGSEQRNCNTHLCPIDCVIGPWGGWGACTTTCGDGTQSRTRVVTQAAENGGTACPSESISSGALTSTQDCNVGPCPIDCQFSEWEPWSFCSVTCGEGTQTRKRTIQTQAEYGGTQCAGLPGSLEESQTCSEGCCPVDCVLSEWSDWGDCTVHCEGGTQTKTRTVTTPASCNGQQCTGAETDLRECNMHKCAELCGTHFLCDHNGHLSGVDPIKHAKPPGGWTYPSLALKEAKEGEVAELNNGH